MFVHKEGLDYKELKTKNIDGKRHYVTPNGNYPSVTTVTSLAIKDGIKAWRERVGEKEANKIASQAARRGTKVHKICEDYLNNVDLNYEEIEPINHFLFKQIKPILDIRLDEVYGLEVPLYSDFLRVAGRVDLIGEFDSQLSIVDFKTSRKTKKKSWIHSYFIQACAYSIMWEEMTNIPIKQLVVLITVDGARPQVFMEHRDTWTEPLYKIIDTYYKQEGD